MSLESQRFCTAWAICKLLRKSRPGSSCSRVRRRQSTGHTMLTGLQCKESCLWIWNKEMRCSGVCLHGVCGLVPGALLISSHWTFLAFLRALLWLGLLDELSDSKAWLALPCLLHVQPGVLLGLILETEVDKFNKRKQPAALARSRSVGAVSD